MRLLALLLAGCGSGVIVVEGDAPDAPDAPAATTPDAPGPTAPVETEGEDYRLRGPYAVRERDGSTETSCRMAWTRFEPDGFEPTALVVLAHGWVRTREQARDRAEHWASWGLAVVTPDLCHASLVDVDHAQNGRDLVALAADVSGGLPVLYAGHSAGGLASLLAAADDPGAVAQLGLDLVDADGLGLDAAPALAVPAGGLVAEPSDCNLANNAKGVYRDAPDAMVLQVIGSDHCDYESPTDWGCETFCAGGAGDDAVVGDAITGLSTAFLLWRSGMAPGAAGWWTPGDPWHQALVDAGAL